MKRLSILLISLLAIAAIVFGCGVIPQGQATTRNFTVSGFKLPTTMVYTASTSAHAQLSSGIATTSGEAKSFVSRLVMQTITAVLEQQGRSAGLSDVIISGILNQLTVQIDYEPLKCMTVTINPSAAMEFPTAAAGAPLPHCIVIGNTVTALCTMMPMNSCKIEDNKNIGPIDSKHLSISGSLTTTNIIMANWSKEMWQRAVNRAVRMLASDPFASHFASAFATVG